MVWLHDLSYFFGGAFLANAVPHFVSGMMGRPFQSPFARPPGKCLSSSTVKVVWGFANFVIAWLLIAHVGSFDLSAADNVIAAGFGVLLMGLVAARAFGRFQGGNPMRRRAIVGPAIRTAKTQRWRSFCGTAVQTRPPHEGEL
jgi:hypothetical protein